MLNFPPMDERDLIKHLGSRLEKPPILRNWLDEDCEIIERGTHYQLVTIDTSSEKVDFPSGAPPFEMGYFSASLSLSDISACGGKPEGILVSLSIPPSFDSQVFEIYEGIIQAAQDTGTPILGGDSNSAGELSISIVSIGKVSKNKVLRRKTAKPGDLVGVTGPLGSFNAGYSAFHNHTEVDYQKMLRQPARIVAGQTLADIKADTNYEISCIDLPDGLIKSLTDNTPPGMGFSINDGDIPVVGDADTPHFISASKPAGDIELLFTANPRLRRVIEIRFATAGQQIFWIGEVISHPEIKISAPGKQFALEIQGFVHKFDGYKLFN